MNTKSQISCVVIDDDLSAREQLAEYIARSGDLMLLKTFADPLIALEYILSQKESIEILFTDVQMPKFSGLQLAAQVRKKVQLIVLVSNYLNNAIEGYGVGADHFLYKPFNFNKFTVVKNEILNKIVDQNPMLTLKISSQKNFVKISIKDIIAIEGNSNYIKVHTKSKVYHPYLKLSDMQTLLQPYSNFKRIGRSFIVNKLYVIKVQAYNLVLENGLQVKVGSTYKSFFNKEVSDWLNQESN